MSTTEEKANKKPALLTHCVDIGNGKRVCISVTLEEVAYCSGCPDCPPDRREHSPECAWGKIERNTADLSPPTMSQKGCEDKDKAKANQVVQCPPPQQQQCTPPSPPAAQQQCTPPPPAQQCTPPPAAQQQQCTPPPPAQQQCTPPPPAQQQCTPPPPAQQKGCPPAEERKECTKPPEDPCFRSHCLVNCCCFSFRDDTNPEEAYCNMGKTSVYNKPLTRSQPEDLAVLQ